MEGVVEMKRLKIVGPCLVSTFVIGMALAGSAQAKWEQCSEGGAATKYTEHQCGTASGTGKWQWKEVTATEEVRMKGSVRLKTSLGILNLTLECPLEIVGTVGPELGRISQFNINPAQCRNIENCESAEKSEAYHLAWPIISYNAEGKVLLEFIGGEPVWSITCRVLGTSDENRCSFKASQAESLVLVNRATKNGTTTELLVLATFQNLRKLSCSLGETEITGSLSVLKTNG